MNADDITWRSPWRGLDDGEAAELQAQLEREIGFRHPLAKRDAVVVGRRIDNDDIVARLNDDTFVNVHLVWTRSAAGLSKDYPSWFAYGQLEGFLTAMQRDASGHGPHPAGERESSATSRGASES